LAHWGLLRHEKTPNSYLVSLQIAHLAIQLFLGPHISLVVLILKHFFSLSQPTDGCSLSHNMTGKILFYVFIFAVFGK